ncbi:MAG: MarR family transcriptional regulator [Geodermatophilaceae bacterium]|nr:MarR family transcriptional regulator [Geodermatophilaceae bacterium]
MSQVPAQPRWLDEHEQATWRTYLAATKAVGDAIESQLQRDVEIPHTYYEILVRLSEAPDRMLRMSQLADLCLASRSRLSHAVTRLEERGWVKRRAFPDDGRGMLAELTDDGQAALSNAAPGHVNAVREQIFDRLTDDQTIQLREISEAIVGGPNAFSTLRGPTSD